LPPGNNKVIVYPTPTETIDQLAKQGITHVRNYGSYWLVQATDAQVDKLFGLYGQRAVKNNDLNRIRLRNLSFDTTDGSPTVPADLREPELPGKRLRLIQFCGPMVPQWLQQIQSVGDVQVICYVPNNAYLIRLDQPTEAKLRALEASGGPIQWIGPFHPFYKIEPGLTKPVSEKQDPLVKVHLMLVPHSESSATMKAIEKLGAVTYSYTRANMTTLFVSAPASTITKMAKLPDVVWIEKEYSKRLLDEVQDLTLAGQTNGQGHGPEPFFEGQVLPGFTNYLDFLYTQVAGTLTDVFQDPFTYPVVDVADTGIDSGPFTGTAIVQTNAPGHPPATEQFTVEPPVHPAFHQFGDARNYSRVVYFAPPWLGGDPPLQLGCADVHIGANDGPFKHAEAMDLLGHGTAVASIIAGYDDGTNTLNKPCLQLVSASNTVLMTFPGNTMVDTNTGETFPLTNSVNCSSGGTVTIAVPTGFLNTCGPSNGLPPTATFTNVVVGIVSNTCPTNVFQDVLYTKIATNPLSEIRVDDNGNKIGMGVSPFGLLGNSRIWQDYSTDLSISGSPPGTGIFGTDGSGFGILTVSGGCLPADFLNELTNCVSDFVALIGVNYDEGARIQNNSWSFNVGIPPSAGGPYTPECATFDVAVRDASLVGSSVSNGIPGPSPLNQEFIVVFACASDLRDSGNNSGSGGFLDITVTAPATAKNIISVGVSDNPRFVGVPGTNGNGCVTDFDSQDMPTFAANGPTLDGRFKPEIVAPGAYVYAALSQIVAVTTNCSLDKTLFPAYPYIVACTNPPCDGGQAPIYTSLYTCVGGSSYAAPAVSGAIQLLWWYFQNRLTDEFLNPMLQPSPAMAKAYLCNAARYLPIADAQRTDVLDTLPSTLQGMGALDLGRMFDGMARVIRDESSPRAISVPLTTTNPAPQQTYFSQSGQTYTLSGQIASNGQPFRVTLAWTDASGQAFAQKELVNDLDLAVVVNGVTYKGNVFAENVSVSRPGDAFDSVNNMESVFLNPASMLNGIPAVAAGTPFLVTVRATDIAGQGVPNVGEAPPSPAGSTNANPVLNQDFALVVYNATDQSDVPNLATNNSCSTAIDVTNYPFSFTNTLNSTAYHQAFPSPTAGLGGPEEFFRIPLPTAGAQISVNTVGSRFDNVLSVWEVQVVPQTIYVRGECGALTEVVSENGANNSSSVSFTADGTNDYFVVVEPHNNNPGGQMVVNISASAVPITLTPSSLTFSNQIVGTTSPVQVVTYLNGTAGPVTINRVSISGPGSNDFVIIPQSSNCAGNTLGPNGDCAVAVAFAPVTNGLRQANLLFADNAVGSPRIASLIGTATAPSPALCLSNSPSLVFSNQSVGTTSAVQSVTITNCGSLPLIMSNVTFTGSAPTDFLLAPSACTNAPIPVGATCTFQLEFAPTKTGTRLANLVIPNNSAVSPATIALQGVGVTASPAICLSSSSINFGTVSVNSTSTVQSLTITNCGTADLVISNISITAGSTAEFSVLSNTCTTVATGSACTVNLVFVPTNGGPQSATLSISDNAPGSPQLVTVSGTGAQSKPDAAIGKTTKLKKMVGFGIINTTGNGQGISQNVHLQKPAVIAEGKHGVSYYIAVENAGTSPDQFTVQGQQTFGGNGFTIKYFLGTSTKPSDSVDVTAAVAAGTFATSTMEAGGVTDDTTMLRAVVFADKTIVAKGTTAIFTVTFTSANDPTRQDTVQIAAVAR
jgi:hypothetical protein